jgi:Rrf2 family protein
VYGKATQTAIAALSRLAEVYDDDSTRLSAVELAESRGLQKAFVGKVLSTLSQAGLIVGTRGPGGGFRFAKHPREVTLHDVYSLFEREDVSEHCPFGGGVCGSGEKCPLHDRLAEVQRATHKMLHETTFDTFLVAYQNDPGEKKWRLSDKPKSGRETYRAPNS